jgi:hypothetical protein
MLSKERESEIAGLDDFSLEIIKLDFGGNSMSPANSFWMDEIDAVGCDDQDDLAEDKNESGATDHLPSDVSDILDDLEIDAGFIVESESLSDDELLMLDKAIGIEIADKPLANDRLTKVVAIWNENEKRLKASKSDQSAKADKKQREIEIYRAGEGRVAYNEYKRAQYAAEVEATEDRAVRSYGAPDDEAKVAKRREQNRLAAAAARAKLKAK